MPSAFAAAELRQALSEIPWGMRTHRSLPDDPAAPDAARAEVDLLEEGERVTVSCSDGGWRIVGSEGRCSKVRSGSHVHRSQLSDGSSPRSPPPVPPRLRSTHQTNTVFDTLDDLMLAVSPAFEAKRMERLMERLAEVASDRQKSRWAPSGDPSTKVAEEKEGDEAKVSAP